jgi:BirA family transcriptional regulator, biotin operon repressor / biotin---[acetyl-CoA-carboxylase] ligase
VPGSRYSRLDRPPLSAAALRRALIEPGGLWTAVDLRDDTVSTNADAAAAAREGAAEGLVVLAERQTGGRGRLGRQWQSPARAGLAVSALLRPPVPIVRYGWLPLLAGVALATVVRRLGELDAVLKWPNDLLVEERKVAGILCEAAPDGSVVVGIGLNVTLAEQELPAPAATSLALAGSACTDRDPLLRALLRELAAGYRAWCAAGGDADACGTPVRVDLPDGTALTGTASDVDADARLTVVDVEGVSTSVAAGDVVHLRPQMPEN